MDISWERKKKEKQKKREMCKCGHLVRACRYGDMHIKATMLGQMREEGKYETLMEVMT